MNSTDIPKNRSAGRPRLFDRDQALDIAMEMFWRQGYEGTSTAQLIAAMGIAQPSLYAAFGSKEGLYREALQRYQEHDGAYMAQALQQDGSARERMDAILRGAAKAFSASGHPPGCMVASGALQTSAQTQGLGLDLQTRRGAAKHALAVLLAQAKVQGELKADADEAVLASYFAAVIQGLSVQAHDGASTADLEAVAQLAMQVWPPTGVVAN